MFVYLFYGCDGDVLMLSIADGRATKLNVQVFEALQVTVLIIFRDGDRYEYIQYSVVFHRCEQQYTSSSSFFFFCGAISAFLIKWWQQAYWITLHKCEFRKMGTEENRVREVREVSPSLSNRYWTTLQEYYTSRHDFLMIANRHTKDTSNIPFRHCYNPSTTTKR